MIRCRVLEKRRTKDYGFTPIELLVVVAVIAILASLALRVRRRMQERARATEDLKNLRQIAIAPQTYLNDHDSTFFRPTEDWMIDLPPKYLAAWKVFREDQAPARWHPAPGNTDL